MKNFTLYLAVAACLVASRISAQDSSKKVDQTQQTSFEDRVLLISNKIDAITKEEKAALKTELEAVNKELDAGTITKAQADEKKMQLAETRSKNIETRVGAAQDELKDLIKQKVDGKIKDKYDYWTIRFKNTTKQDSIRKSRGESRTTSQFVFALGANNLVTDGAVANSDFRYWGSHFYEWGFTNNTRLFKNDNLLHLKYGVSVMYNNLRPTDNRLFVANGNQTDLETSSVNLHDSRFRNVYVTVPVHLEFDFTKPKTNADGKKLFRTHESVRFGIGGYAGFRVKSKQILKFDEGDHDVTVKEKGGFNTNDFIYGVSTYIGYKETSLYLKYDLNPLFKDNAIKQNNISLGVRFDFN
ncbi:MAG TPA: hypothetical protein PKN96_03915 [Flavobacterium sp.]|uniref:hypothetical protein n=1 Tax=Flavobacterium sp. TaxID=239 RepID=UPI002C3CCFAE|nr:hypothetical protein [Flavobacterium sp.]HNP32412.1 hypothetical protein [Flavobacterium sp.]